MNIDNNITSAIFSVQLSLRVSFLDRSNRLGVAIGFASEICPNLLDFSSTTINVNTANSLTSSNLKHRNSQRVGKNRIFMISSGF